MKRPRRRFHTRDRDRPPIPPEVDQLRDVVSVIDPGRTYSLQLLDGTVFSCRGSDLLETARLMVELADADRSGDFERLLRAVLAVQADVDRARGEAVVLCAAVGDTAGPIPPGTALTECSGCHRPLWITRTNHGELEPSGVRPICERCLEKKARGMP